MQRSAREATISGLSDGALGRFRGSFIRATTARDAGGPTVTRPVGAAPIETRRRCVVAVDVSASQTAVMVTDPLGYPLLT
jgi:hypothetical protein